jgi:molybdenum cofactor sulfurtransferase
MNESLPTLAPPAFGPSAAESAAESDFTCRHPDFDPDGAFAALRRSEYGRLDAQRHVYLDYAGGSLYAAGQIDVSADRLRSAILGNPHSRNPASAVSTDLVAQTRRVVHDFFDAPPEDYLCVFTANASAALRLVGESYRFAPGGRLALTADNHNSVNGIREYARRKGAEVVYVPVVPPDLRLDRAAMTRALDAGDPVARNLLAFPAQSNYSGVQHPLDLVEEAHGRGWDVLVDAAAFAPTNRLDVGRIRPDFVTVSFYKIIGYPTGVGCLLIRRGRVEALRRPWFAGGTVTIASVQGDGYYLRPDESAFEDGTLNYLALPAVTDGLRRLRGIGLTAIHRRVSCLTQWLLDGLSGLRHADGRPVVRIHGPTDTMARGGTIAFVVLDRVGGRIGDGWVEELALRRNISLRTGCFCNPGAAEAAHHLTAEHLRPWFGRVDAVSNAELRRGLLAEHGVVPSAIRVSVGVATNFADVFGFLTFLGQFVDRSGEEIERAVGAAEPDRGRP